MAPRCEVCTELLNRSDHKQVACPYCPYVACTSCHERYLLDITEDAHCMACHKAWSRDVLASNFTSKFVTKTYKGRREDLLFERERSLMPATQQYVELEKKSRQLTQQEVQLRVKLSYEEEELGKIRGLSTSVLAVKHGLQNEFEAFLLRQEMVAIQMKVIAPIQIDIGTIQWRNIQMRERIIGRHVEMEKRAFVRACPHDACKGFLSTAWKCGLCENWTCPTCHEVKGPEKDAAHTCDPNNVATAELLARDSRNCPKCAAGIFKINGCFAKDTVIPLFDGTTKLAQDISTGDVLIGDDGKARTVMETCSGRDDMFKVIQNKGVEYTVNSKHKLVLKFSGDRSIHKLGEAHVVRWFDRTLKSKKFENIEEAVDFHKGLQFSDEIEMLVEDYVNLGDSTKKFMMGFKSSGVRTSIIVEPLGQGTYYGWSIDGNKRFVLEDLTVARNCDQMWCTQCHTAFSWRTGRVETHMVHNPHYYEYQRAHGTPLPRAVGDVPCGGFPEWSVILKLVGGRQSIQTNGCGVVQEVINAYRSHPHAMYSLIPRYTEQDRRTENRDLRIKFMIGDITDDEFKKKIQQREKANQRKRAIRQVIEMYTTVITDLFQAFQENRDILVLHESLCGLRDHYAMALKKVQFAYKCAVPDLGSNFNFRV